MTPALQTSVAVSSVFIMMSSERLPCFDVVQRSRELPQFINKNLPGRIFRVELEKIKQTVTRSHYATPKDTGFGVKTRRAGGSDC